MKTSASSKKKLGIVALVALGIGSMIGAGVFNSPTDLILKANPQVIVITWGIGGIGVVSLAFIFQLLTHQRPKLTGGIASYAKSGFGDFIGFLAAFGYWVSGLLGNVAFFTLMMKTLNSLLPAGYRLQPILLFMLASVILWFIVWLQTKGAKNVGFINIIVTIAKLIPLVLVMVIGAFVWHPETFNVANWTTVLASSTQPTASTSFLTQINRAMGVILWCFIGVEASTVLAEKAKSQNIVGKATIIAIFVTLAVYVGISVISMGVIPAKSLAAAETPLADVLAATAIGTFGSAIVKIGILISLLGALISWMMLSVQLAYIAAKEGLLPHIFTKTSKQDVPIAALLITNGITQVFFFVLLSEGLQSMYNFVLLLATTCILIPYFLSSMFAFKVVKADSLRGKHLLATVLAILYTVYCFISVGIVSIAASCLLYGIGMLVFYKTKKDQKQAVTKKEWLAMGSIFLLGAVMAVLLATGIITIKA
ncbi:amino acid permease [Virgibacillus sp. MG-45]|uniref:amino acid permease n=1 Tax=Virgibacillus sp. MG-45 TaxID=3102791 RepID=UPI002ED8147E